MQYPCTAHAVDPRHVVKGKGDESDEIPRVSASGYQDIRLLLISQGEQEIHAFIEQNKALYCNERPTIPYTAYRLVKSDLGRGRSVRDILVESAIRPASDQQRIRARENQTTSGG